MKIKLLILLFAVLALSLAALEIPVEARPQISVSVTGYVAYPGSYGFVATDRLSDALKKADNPYGLNPQMVTEQPLLPSQHTSTNPIPMLREPKSIEPDYNANQSLRRIRLTRNGAEQYYDLMMYYRLGDLSQNPLLKDGDVIFVAAIQEIISVNGAVLRSGELEFQAGDTLGKAFELAQGLLPGADTANIQHYRFVSSGVPFQVEIINLKQNPEAGNTVLNAFDRIMVPYDSEFRARRVVTLSGEIRNQGEFIISDTTTLYDIIVQAGGLTSRADLDHAMVLNRAVFEQPDLELERLKTRPMSDMTPLEYNYLRTRMRQSKGLYSVDFNRLMSSQGKEGNIILNNGDYIYIPEKLNAVWVSGHVRNPGIQPWVEGKTWQEYVETAGSYGNYRKLTGLRIIRATSGNWEKVKNDIVINPGDTIFIPEQVDRSLWVDVKDVITLLSSAITIIIGVQNLTK